MERTYKVTWLVSPLDENPEIHTFDSWYEMQDWIDETQEYCDIFESCLETGLVKIEES